MTIGYLNIADFSIRILGEELNQALNQLDGFEIFFTSEAQAEVVGTISIPGVSAPSFTQVLYTSTQGGYLHRSGTYADGFLYNGTDDEGRNLSVWKKQDEDTVYIKGDSSVYFFRFSLWLAFSLLTCLRDTVALHTSCVVYQDRAVMFLGESGTGKSTHTRLWRENIPGSFLLNDDSPILRILKNKVYAYGSPWSGKTPCYKAERHELAACVRLSQAPENRIQKLKALHAYGALHPSCPPDLAYHPYYYKGVSQTLGLVLRQIPVYHLACLPDGEAARLSCKTVFG